MTTKLIFFLLTLITLTIYGCGGDSSTGSDDGTSIVTVAVRDNFFDPKSISIQPGTTVRWVLRGTMPDHTVTDNDGAFDSGFRFRNDGDRFERTFGSADNGKTILYHCETHWMTDEMQGSIRVGQNAPDPPPRY